MQASIGLEQCEMKRGMTYKQVIEIITNAIQKDGTGMTVERDMGKQQRSDFVIKKERYKMAKEKVHRKTYDSYRITKCPEYVPDKKG